MATITATSDPTLYAQLVAKITGNETYVILNEINYQVFLSTANEYIFKELPTMTLVDSRSLTKHKAVSYTKLNG